MPEDFAKPHHVTLAKWLKCAVAAGLVQVEGTGRKADPYRYWTAAAEARWRAERPFYDLFEKQRRDPADTDLDQLQVCRPLATCALMRRAELLDLDSRFWEFGQDLQLAAKGFDNFPQSRDLHVGLVLELGQTGLLDAKRLCDLLLALARQLTDLAEEQFGKQLLSPARRLGLGFLRGRALDEVVE